MDFNQQVIIPSYMNDWVGGTNIGVPPSWDKCDLCNKIHFAGYDTKTRNKRKKGLYCPKITEETEKQAEEHSKFYSYHLGVIEGKKEEKKNQEDRMCRAFGSMMQ